VESSPETLKLNRYSLGELHTLAKNSGFRMEAQWMDREWPFAENLFIAV
jgi:hypothetical protein